MPRPAPHGNPVRHAKTPHTQNTEPNEPGHGRNGSQNQHVGHIELLKVGGFLLNDRPGLCWFDDDALDAFDDIHNELPKVDTQLVQSQSNDYWPLLLPDSRI